MKPDIKKKWVAALRSGNYKQGRKRLMATEWDSYNRNFKHSYCCLGVLCHIVQKEETNEMVSNVAAKALEFERAYLPDPVAVSAGIPVFNDNRKPEDNVLDQHTLAELNDQGRSFAQIADVIERGL